MLRVSGDLVQDYWSFSTTTASLLEATARVRENKRNGDYAGSSGRNREGMRGDMTPLKEETTGQG